MRKLTLASVLVFVVVLAATPALSKELKNAQVCGAKNCATIPHSDQDTLMDLASPSSLSQEPPAAGPFYTVKLNLNDDAGALHSWTLDYYPEENLIRTTGITDQPTWYSVDVATDNLAGILNKLEPFPAVAFDAAMEMGPGEFTRAHMKPFIGLDEGVVAETSAPKIDSKPANAPAPSSSSSWLVPVLVVLGFAILALGGMRIQRRRAATMAGASHPFV
jgi:hypothetical protein